MGDRKDIVSFTIPFLPVSCNSIYGISSKGRGVRVFLRSEARAFKEKAKMFMPPRTISQGSFLGLEVNVHAEWFFKNGNVRKLDIQNLEKILIDAIAEKYDVMDQMVWHKSCKKQDGNESVQVTIFEVFRKATEPVTP